MKYIQLTKLRLDRDLNGELVVCGQEPVIVNTDQISLVGFRDKRFTRISILGTIEITVAEPFTVIREKLGASPYTIPKSDQEKENTLP